MFVAVAFTTSLLVIVSALLGLQVARLWSLAREVDHADRFIAEANAAGRQVLAQEAALRGFLLTGEPSFALAYSQQAPAIALGRLAGEARDENERSRAEELRTEYDGWSHDAAAILSGAADVVSASTVGAIDGRAAHIDRLEDALGVMARTERQRRSREWTEAERELHATIVVAIAVLALVAATLALSTRRALHRVRLDYENALQEQRRLEQMREMFVGILGHDLRTPLTAVITGGHALLRGSLPERSTSLVQRIVSSGERMRRLVEQLLDLTRARVGGGLRLDLSNVALDDLVGNVVDEIRAANTDRAIELEAHGPLRCSVDPDRFAQVVANLLSNAVTHGAGDAPIRVSLTRECECVQLAVQNGGRPIPPQLLDTLFQPFRRADDASRRSSSGLGLGLYIVHEIVEAHDGAIDVTSDEEQGTIFRVTLPCRALVV